MLLSRRKFMALAAASAAGGANLHDLSTVVSGLGRFQHEWTPLFSGSSQRVFHTCIAMDWRTCFLHRHFTRPRCCFRLSRS